MGGALGCLACNAASCVCSGVCGAVSNTCGKAAKRNALVGRLVYAVVLLLAALLAFVLKNLPQWIDSVHYLQFIPGFQGCTPTNSTLISTILDKNFGVNLGISVPEQLCYGTMSVYRVAFGLAIFHFIMALMMIGVKSTKDWRSDVQHSWWTIKLLGLAGLIVVSFFIPNVAFIPFGYLALFGSGLFILIQLVLLVDFAHSWQESWVGKYEESENRLWVVLLLGATIVLYLASLSGTVVMYVYFVANESVCWFNTLFITLNLIFCFAFSIFSIHPKLQEKNPRLGLLQSAVVTAYCTFLIWSSLSSEPATLGCSTFPLFMGPGDGFSMFTGLLFTFLALAYSAFRVSGSSEEMGFDRADPARKALLAAMPPDEEKGLLKNEKTADVQTDGKDKKETRDNSDSEEAAREKKQKKKRRSGRVEDSDSESESVESDTPRYNYSFFHVTFCLAALYLSMVLTNWQSVRYFDAPGTSSNDNSILVDQGMESVWVKAVSSWCTVALYVWTMVAPIFFPDREFA